MIYGLHGKKECEIKMSFVIVGTAKDETEVMELTKIVKVAQVGIRMRELNKGVI